MIKVETDGGSGFCFGVVNAIRKAEMELRADSELYCLGDIVHNSREVARLEGIGLKTITHGQMAGMRRKRVLLRAHGEPPATYLTAERNGICVIDATCPVVLKLQKKIRRAFLDMDAGREQIVIFGKTGHAEVNGLVGQTDGRAVVIESVADLGLIDFGKNICLFSQTTMSVNDFRSIVSAIEERAKGIRFKFYDTVCRQVANRIPDIIRFAAGHDLILFVAGEKSSNGRVLLDECRKANGNTYLIADAEGIDVGWLTGVERVGVCGATSTPKWLMEEVAERVRSLCVFGGRMSL
ncbi:MAG: 4-hydroxy-3-methylbut-2-enyl diphosphate reductase [Dysgonamonadaceae bacterium]|jgi:4-hydroxy-3-methylbut-2-enyl diphosphate reductase|nr:4-hydroxy-3-methylbut-2-enyl diphosphate reductase [Dysgonamonadaceae bacterium]